jgi:uncharacterized protein GlcG (DUF336 family)
MAKAQKNKLPLSTITIFVSIGVVALVGAYIFGIQQGRFLVTDAAKSTIVEALDTAKTETKVDQVVGQVDEEATLKAVTEQIESEATAKKAAEEKAATTASKPKETTKTTTTTPKETKTVMRGVTLTNPLVAVETESVIFSASLPESLVVDCKVFLQRVGDKAGAWNYNKSEAARSKCVTSIPRSQLAAGTWNYELTVMSSSVYGQNNPKGSFEIN